MAARRIAIAGCGPAGLAAALLLHRDGHAVTMFERFDAPRPAGSGLMLQPTGLAVLAQLGLADAILAHGARIERLFGKAGGRVVLDVRYAALGGKRFGLGIHRAALFGVLHDAVQASAIRIDWHSTSPQLGQGANMALLDAWALSLALRRGADPAEAEALRRRHVRLYQAMSLLLTPVYQSDSRMLPLLRDCLVGPLARLRSVMRLQATMVAGLVGNPLRTMGLG